MGDGVGEWRRWRWCNVGIDGVGNGVGVTARQSDGARTAKSSPTRFPTNVIGPLFRQGTLGDWLLPQNASGSNF